MILVVVVQKRIEDYLAIEELFENPYLAELEDGYTLASLDNVEG